MMNVFIDARSSFFVGCLLGRLYFLHVVFAVHVEELTVDNITEGEGEGDGYAQCGVLALCQCTTLRNSSFVLCRTGDL